MASPHSPTMVASTGIAWLGAGRLVALLSGALCPSRARPPASAASAALRVEASDADPELAGDEPDRPVAYRAPHLSAAVVGPDRCRVRDGVLPEGDLEQLVEAVRQCPYFGENAGENDFYKGTLGFHVKFRDTHRHLVEEHLSFLKPIMAATLRPECNCFFLNVFFARPDGQDYHTDNFFTPYCGSFRPTDIVTVAYLAASEAMVGGELVILAGSQEEIGVPPRRGTEGLGEGATRVLQRVQPRPGRVVDFDGRLMHAVLPFQSPEPRVSLVVEQCRLPRRHFLKTPRFSVYCQRSNRELQIA